MSEVDLARITTAEEHVRQARGAIVAQRAIIDRRRAAGSPVHQEEAILLDFERSLAIFEDHLERVREGR